MRYIGNKIQLLDEIKNVIDLNCEKCKTFLDIFSGTGTVARFFKSEYEIMSNDILYFSYVLQMATVQNDSVPDFKKINDFLGVNVIEYLNNINSLVKNIYSDNQLFIFNTYSPEGNRNYFTRDNAKTIDLWRLELENWKEHDLLSENEYYYLLALIIETVPFFSNIAGTYGAFLKTWDPRALKPIKLVDLDVITNNKKNKCFNVDASSLLDKVEGDILYIDPPYNERQYLPNYHILETVAKYDYPVVKGVTGIRPYSKEKSLFCSKNTAIGALESMIEKANFRYIMLSYNTDGIMDYDSIVSIMRKRDIKGECKVVKIPHKRFKSRTLVNNSDLYELLFLIEKGEMNAK